MNTQFMTFSLQQIGRSFFVAMLIASAALAFALPGAVSAEDNSESLPNPDRAHMAADCAGAGGTYFESGSYSYGCVHEDSTTTCDDRAEDGGCVNVVNSQPVDSGPGYPIFDRGPVAEFEYQEVLPTDDQSGITLGKPSVAYPDAPATVLAP